MRNMFLFFLLLFTFVCSTFAAPKKAACNGHAALCDRIYSDVSFVGAHDSPFVGPLPQQNQNLDVVEQLDLGIRFLQGQTQINDDGTLNMCHTSCLLEDAGTLEGYLKTVKGWLDDHPNEVITLLLTNDEAKIEDFDDAFQGSGIKEYAFTPKDPPVEIDSWPTLQELIDSGKRLVTFLDYDADTKKVPYILDEFAHFFETPFEVTDSSFEQCRLDRPADSKPDGKMYIVNHFLQLKIFPDILIPHRLKADDTNAATGEGSIGAQAALCEEKYKRKPNVVLVDFVGEGQAIKAQDALNGF